MNNTFGLFHDGLRIIGNGLRVNLLAAKMGSI